MVNYIEAISYRHSYNIMVYIIVKFQGKPLIGLKWVITESETQDGQKQKVKARLVCKGYQEEFQPQSDSPTIGRSNLLVFTAVAANNNFHIWAIDIKGAYLQSNPIDRDSFVRPPPDIQQTMDDDIVWKLNKPMYGLDDSGRKCYLKIKEILTEVKFEEMNEDNALFYIHQSSHLVAMISCHVDNFKIVSSEEYSPKIIDTISKSLTISKIDKDSFRFTGVDFTRTNDSITISMEDYTNSQTKIDHFRTGPKEDPLTKIEHKLYRKKVGQLSWLASNVRPDLCFPVQSLSQKSARPTLEDLKKINFVVTLAKSQESKGVFKYVDSPKYLQIYGVSDASWSVKGSPVSGTVFMLGSSRSTRVSTLTWKSKTILNPTKSVKDAETRSFSLNTENSIHLSKMVERLHFGDVKKRIPVKCFTDNRPLLETIASTKSPANKGMLDVIRYLKDKLSWEEVSSYSWLSTKWMISDFLMKQMKISGDVWDIFHHGVWEEGASCYNLVPKKGLEFLRSK